jgi:ectoine hydroxylase-related dioxygenase (phytanoyl-CoA dioxygenase family)
MKWHTDNKQERKKIKFTGLIFIIYVCDVDEGEFQFIEGSHKFSNKFDSPEITNEFIDKNYSKLIKSFKLPKGSLLIYDATGIHRAKPFKNNKYVRKSLYFQVDAYDENSEKILLNTKFLNNFTPEIKKLLGFGKENNYPLYPKTNLNRLPINGKILSLVSKWFIYRLTRNVFRTEPRRIVKFLKKFI